MSQSQYHHLLVLKDLDVAIGPPGTKMLTMCCLALLYVDLEFAL